jgi:hypothetical protein
MIFDPDVHTREFLMQNSDIALELAKKSKEFARSDLASDRTLLAVKDKLNRSVAQVLALSSTEWAFSATAQDFNVLKMRGMYDATVAHALATKHADWIDTDASKSREILELRDNDGDTVAHALAYYNGNWSKTEMANDIELLLMTNNKGHSVVFHMINRVDVSIDKLLCKKEILTACHENKILAEVIYETKLSSQKMELSSFIMKLIELGVAYKHSSYIGISTGEKIVAQTMVLMDDCLNSEVALRYASALYSTCSHAVRKHHEEQILKNEDKWTSLLVKSEQLIRQHFNMNHELYDIEHHPNMLCEPADVLIKKIQAEKALNIGLDSVQGRSAEGHDCQMEYGVY